MTSRIAVVMSMLGMAGALHLSPAATNLACPKKSELFTASAISLHSAEDRRKAGFERVVLADFPSTGSTWLRQLMTAASKDVCKSPSCSIYESDGDNQCKVAKGVYCPCGENHGQSLQDAGAIVVKTHFPAQELWHGNSILEGQYNSSMNFDKVLQLVRHPIATVNSNIRRWHSSKLFLAANLQCWGNWWERVTEAADKSKVHRTRYEDLCTDTAAELLRIFQFVGGCYQRVDLHSIKDMLAMNPELKCTHAHELQQLTTVNGIDYVVGGIMTKLSQQWGYRLDGSSEWQDTPQNKSTNTRHMAVLAVAGHPRPTYQEDEAISNPWATVWGL